MHKEAHANIIKARAKFAPSDRFRYRRHATEKRPLQCFSYLSDCLLAVIAFAAVRSITIVDDCVGRPKPVKQLRQVCPRHVDSLHGFALAFAKRTLRGGSVAGIVFSARHSYKHGGNVRVESEVDKGSCFTVALIE